jgi:hypothetical protein
MKFRAGKRNRTRARTRRDRREYTKDNRDGQLDTIIIIIITPIKEEDDD